MGCNPDFTISYYEDTNFLDKFGNVPSKRACVLACRFGNYDNCTIAIYDTASKICTIADMPVDFNIKGNKTSASGKFLCLKEGEDLLVFRNTILYLRFTLKSRQDQWTCGNCHTLLQQNICDPWAQLPGTWTRSPTAWPSVRPSNVPPSGGIRT